MSGVFGQGGLNQVLEIIVYRLNYGRTVTLPVVQSSSIFSFSSFLFLVIEGPETLKVSGFRGWNGPECP